MYFTAISYLKDLIKHANMQFPYYVIDIQIPLHFHLQCHVCVCVCVCVDSLKHTVYMTSHKAGGSGSVNHALLEVILRLSARGSLT